LLEVLSTATISLYSAETAIIPKEPHFFSAIFCHSSWSRLMTWRDFALWRVNSQTLTSFRKEGAKGYLLFQGIFEEEFSYGRQFHWCWSYYSSVFSSTQCSKLCSEEWCFHTKIVAPHHRYSLDPNFPTYLLLKTSLACHWLSEDSRWKVSI